MGELLTEIWPTPDPVERRTNKVLYCSAAGYLDEDDEADPEVLTALHPLAEEMDWTAMNHSNQWESEPKKSKKAKGQGDGLGNRQGVSQKEMQAVQGVMKYLKEKGGQATLTVLCNRFHVKKKLLAKFSDVISVTQDDMVKVTGSGSNGHEEPKKSKKGGGKAAGKGDSASKGGGKGAKNAKNEILDARIGQLCSIQDIAVKPVDFDSRVRTWFVRFQQRRGLPALEAAFDVLGEWCTKKERDQVRSWPSYLMVLLRNWEREAFEGESEAED